MSVLPAQSAAQWTPPRGFTIRRLMMGLFAAQIAFGAGLVWLDATSRTPGDERITPAPAAPIAPGDQTRRYDPARVPSRTGGGRTGLIDLPTEMTSLEFRFLERAGFGRIMAVEGAIAPGDAKRFAAALEEAMAGEAPPETVSLHSPGGSLSDALVIGKAVREAGLDTLVVAGGACVSACPTILFGGVERRISRDAWIGMHQSFLGDVSLVTTRRAVSEVQRLQGEVIAFTREAGVDPGVHVHALTTPPEDVYFLLPEQLEEYKVATELLD